MQSKYFKFLLIALIVVIAVPQITFASWYNPFSWHIWGNFWNYFLQKPTQNPVACPTLAKLCPDGSSVSPKGPKCQFPACPSAKSPTAGWKTFTSNELKYSFKYPSDWKVIPNYVYSAAGAGGLVGYTITTSDSKTPPDNERIDIGGAQVDCASLSNLNRQEHPAGVLCKTNLPIYTFSTDPNVINVFNIMVDSISEIKILTDNDYNFQIEYPNNWFAEKNFLMQSPITGVTGNNSLSNTPDLVFCPPNLTYHSSGVTGCNKQPSGYQSGMIYLFAYNTDPKPNNTNYQYLGFNSGKYYYLFDDNGSKDVFSQMLSTFKFTK